MNHAETTSRVNERIKTADRYLIVFHGERKSAHRLSSGRTLTVGRGAECDVCVDSEVASRKHFTVYAASTVLLTDLGSTNGSKLNGVALPPNEPVSIDVGAMIEAGGVFFMLTDHDPVARPRSRSAREGTSGDIVVEDQEMLRLHDLVESVARSTLPVLIVGETGVGKEILSTAVHERSPRAKKPLVRINAAALPETLLESELFGFERGAFTGAAQTKRGLIESADGGSFLLDEIGEMPLSTQAKLLRVLESGEITRLGALKPSTIDVRFIAATNRDLIDLVGRGLFRRDLYYRLNGITIRIPPLRERTREIASLALQFLACARAAEGRPLSFSSEAIDRLQRHAWPGNVRELRNVVERAAAICVGDVVRAEHILLDSFEPVAEAAPFEARQGLLRTSPDADREAILKALEGAGGNQSRAAQALGVSRRTLMKWLDRHGVRRPRKG